MFGAATNGPSPFGQSHNNPAFGNPAPAFGVPVFDFCWSHPCAAQSLPGLPHEPRRMFTHGAWPLLELPMAVHVAGQPNL